MPSGQAAQNWPERLKQGWKANVGEGHSSPVASSGRVFQFARQDDPEVTAAFDLTSGKKLWEQGYAAPYQINPAAAGHGLAHTSRSSVS